MAAFALSHLCATAARRHGFSLLEILVSLVVLSAGMLGAAGLQATALQAQREARMQSTGVRFATEMAELLHSNHAIARLTHAAHNPYLIDRDSASSAVHPACGIPGASACAGPFQTAQRDVEEWWWRLSPPSAEPPGELPGARAVICFDSSPYEHSGLPRWECDHSGVMLSIKIGWTRAHTRRAASGADATSAAPTQSGAFDHALRPAVVMPVALGMP